MIRLVRVKKSSSLREYLLDHNGLSSFPNKGDNERVNVPCFREDLKEGRLNFYRGESVAYHKGVLCGQSADGNDLYNKAKEYYGKSNLAVFRVPKEEETLDTILTEALGEY